LPPLVFLLCRRRLFAFLPVPGPAQFAYSLRVHPSHNVLYATKIFVSVTQAVCFPSSMRLQAHDILFLTSPVPHISSAANKQRAAFAAYLSRYNLSTFMAHDCSLAIFAVLQLLPPANHVAPVPAHCDCAFALAFHCLLSHLLVNDGSTRSVEHPARRTCHLAAPPPFVCWHVVLPAIAPLPFSVACPFLLARTGWVGSYAGFTSPFICCGSVTRAQILTAFCTSVGAQPCSPSFSTTSSEQHLQLT
jgi:hypothetical protein